MVSSKKELIGELPAEPVSSEIGLRSGKRVLIRPLPPSVRLRSASLNKFEKLLFILKNGIVQPEMSDSEILSLTDRSLSDAVEIYNGIQNLCGEYDRHVLKLIPHTRDSELFAVLEKIAELRGEK